MKSSLSARQRVGHMLDAIAWMETAVSGVTEENYFENFILQAALQRWLQIIGEAAYKLDKTLKAANPQTPWKAIEGMRHIIVHDYFGVDLQRIWNVVQYDLPELKTALTKLYESLP